MIDPSPHGGALTEQETAMTATTTKTRKAATAPKADETPKAPKAEKVTPETVLAAIRDKAAADGLTVGGVAVEIYEGETKASQNLATILRRTPILAAQAHGVRGAKAEAAKALRAAEGISQDAANQRVTRYVKCGRVLAAHPTLDPVEVYAITNRLTDEQVDKVVSHKDSETALAAGMKAKAENKAKADEKGKGEEKAATRTTADQWTATAADLKKAVKMTAADAKAGQDVAATVAQAIALMEAGKAALLEIQKAYAK